MTNTARDKNKQNSGNASKGFASMPPKEVKEIASKGGTASAEKAGHEGMSARGHKGGESRAEQLARKGYVELGHKGGIAPHESRGRQAKKNNDEEEEA
jgi:hypothetical protein